jgi:hypothetical protein
MNRSMTFLAPGQRYISASGHAWQVDHQLTILDVQRDLSGAAVVTYRCTAGVPITTHAADIEEAVLDGHIVPVTGLLRPAAC